MAFDLEIRDPDVVKLLHSADWFRVYIMSGILKLETGNRHLNLGISFTPTAAELYNLGKLFLQLATGERSWPCENYYPKLEGLAELPDFQRDCESNGHYLCDFCWYKKPVAPKEEDAGDGR